MRTIARRSSLLALLAVVAALKIAYLFFLASARPGVFWNPDSATYARPALALLSTGRYAQSSSPGAAPELNRTPGYPATIAAVYAAIGHRPLALAVLNILLSLASAFAIAVLATRLFSAEAGFLAALLFSLEPGTFRFSTVVLSETPFVLTLVLLLLAIERWSLSPRPSRGAIAGALLALGVLVRPLLVPFVALAPVLFLVLFRRAGVPWRRVAANVAAFLLPVVLLVGAWLARNQRIAGRPIVTTIAEVNLYMYRGAKVEAEATGESLAAVQQRFGWDEFLYRFGYVEKEEDVFGSRRYADVHPETSRLSTAELARLWGEKGRAILRAHPFLALKQAVRGAAWVLLGPGAVNWAFALGLVPASSPIVTSAVSGEGLGTLAVVARTSPFLLAVSIAFFLALVFLYAAAAAGIRRARARDRASFHAAALLVFATLLLVSAAPEGIDDRFRLPLVPLVCLYAGIGLAPRESVHHPERGSA